jgi:uncharacterized protein
VGTRLRTLRTPIVVVVSIAIGVTTGWLVRPARDHTASASTSLASQLLAAGAPAGTSGKAGSAICPAATSPRAVECGPIVVSAPPNTIAVVGTGAVSAPPDEAVLSLGVQTRGSTATEALRANASRMNSVLRALARSGVARGDIATTSVNVSADYSSGGTPSGFVADNEVTVTLRALSKVGATMDSTVAAGANVTNGVTFQLSDQSTGRAAALKAAVADARSQAEALAAAVGGKLGGVVSINATGGGGGSPVFDRVAASAGSAAPTPIVAPDSVQGQVSVTVVYSLVTG